MRPEPLRLLLLSALFLAPEPALAAAGGWALNGPSAVRLITPWRVAPAAASEVRLGLHFRLQPGWHVYWKNSGDAGYPPTASFFGPRLAGAEILWPAPRRFELPGGLVAFGYEREVVYPVLARLLPTGKPGQESLRWTADVDYLVCQVDCIPYRSTLAVTQPLGEPQPDPETASLIAAWWNRLPRSVESLPEVAAETAFENGEGQPALTVRLHGVVADSRGADLFLETNDLFDSGRPRVESMPGGVIFQVPLTRRQATRLPPATTFAWTATGLARIRQPLETLSVEARRSVALEDGVPSFGTSRRLGALVRSRGPGPASLFTALAFLSTFLALVLWGLMELPFVPPTRHKDLRTSLGFAACAATVWVLYALSLVVGAERLALVELALLVVALLSWLRRAGRSGKLEGPP